MNDQDKEVDAEDYITKKLNKIYEEYYEKLQETDKKLKNDQQEVMFTIQVL